MIFLQGLWGYVASAVSGALVAALIAWRVTAWADSDTLHTAQDATKACTLARETDRADANQKTATGLEASIQAALKANAATASDAAERAHATALLLEELNNVPATKSCASSPAMRVLFDSLRQRSAAAAN